MNLTDFLIGYVSGAVITLIVFVFVIWWNNKSSGIK